MQYIIGTSSHVDILQLLQVLSSPLKRSDMLFSRSATAHAPTCMWTRSKELLLLIGACIS